MKFLKQVADSTGASVHGSDGKVGSAEQGGSWELSRHASPRPPFSGDALESFEGVLGYTFTKNNSGYLTSYDGNLADLIHLLDPNGQFQPHGLRYSTSYKDDVTVTDSADAIAAGAGSLAATMNSNTLGMPKGQTETTVDDFVTFTASSNLSAENETTENIALLNDILAGGYYYHGQGAAPYDTDVAGALYLLGAVDAPSLADINVTDDASTLLGSKDAIAGFASVTLDGGTTTPISLDDVTYLSQLVEVFPNEYPIAVSDSAVKIAQYYVRGSPAG